MFMMQGDSYPISIEITLDSGPADEKSFEDIEVVLGDIRKTQKDGEITYDHDKKVFMIPLSQDETFRLSQGVSSAQVRVKLGNGYVMGTQMDGIKVLSSISREVL